MNKSEIVCCIGCGRDTFSGTGICFRCKSGNTSIAMNKGIGMKDRSMLPSYMFADAAEGMGIGENEENDDD